ncbi:MAG: xanthine dehydrogenase family protein molybdopterin-binding subunit [Candidatus Binatia bacterium]
MKYVGRFVPMLTNRVLAAGKGTFVGDLDLDNVAHLVVLRSAHGHARVRSIDTKAAEALPGVALVMTGADLRKVMKPVPWAADPAAIGGNTIEIYPLAGDRVRYAGEPVVAIVADDRYTAHEAARLIEIDYEPLPAVTDAVRGIEPDAPLVEPSWGTNVLLRKNFTRGDFEGALKEADGVVEGTVKAQRYAPMPIEPRAYAASYDSFTGRITVWSSTQNPHPLRGLIAEALSIADTDVRVIQPNVGGGFGGKVPAFPEEILVAFLSRRLERPIKWVEERTEHLSAGGHAREETLSFKAGYLKDGSVSALKVRVVADVGAPTGLVGWAMSFVSAFCVPGPYKIDNCEVDLYSVVTNKGPWNGYRAFGKEAAAFLMDRIMDKVADAAGLDRAEVRLKNFLPPSAFPFKQVSGAILDSGDYGTALQSLLDRVDYANFPKRQAEARRNGKLLGIGIGFELTPEGGAVPRSRVIQGYDGTTVRMSPGGRVTVLTGVTSPGSGNETGIAQIVADELGVDINSITVVQGDTDHCPYGLGNYSSRSIMMGGAAAQLAAKDLREKLFTVASRMLEVLPADLEAEGGFIRLRGAPQRQVSMADVAGEIYRHTYGPAAETVEPGLESTRYSRIGNLYHQPERQDGHFSMYPTWPYGACALEVEVDPDTGFVKVQRCVFIHDCGTVINPGLVDANVHGGLAQGLGGALFERMAYDDAGQFLTGTFMDYTLPTADDLPSFELMHHNTPSPFTDLGTKGAGESGVGAPLSAMCAAVENALAEWGPVIDETPVMPDRVWRALHQAKSAERSA